MKFKTLGRTGIKVSQLCFGTMSFGGDADEATSAAMYKACRDAGINFFDSANVYNNGRSEEMLGKFMASHRDELVITSKVFGSTSKNVNDGGLSRRHITRAVEDSLRRLNTDRIDIYFVHQFDDETPMEETISTLDDLVRQGKILYPASSNWAAWQVAKAAGISERKNLARFECLQPMYNLAKRQAEVELLPMAESEEIGVIPYNPLGGGLLTGKYGKGKKPAQGRIVENKMYNKRYFEEKFLQVAEDYTAYAAQKGVDQVAMAVAWVMANPAITSPIIGARNPEQLAGSLAALDIDMTPEWRDEISALSPTPPPATDRTEEQK